METVQNRLKALEKRRHKTNLALTERSELDKSATGKKLLWKAQLDPRKQKG